jgi:hypothetical protein
MDAARGNPDSVIDDVSDGPAAGARRAPAAGLAFVAVLAAAPLVRAHDRHPAEPRTPRPAPAPAVPAAAPARSPTADPGSGVVHTTGVRPLRLLAAEASAVLVGDVTRTESYDEDRLRVHRIRVQRVLRGRLDEVEAGVLDIRGALQRPPLLTDGERVVLLVRPAPTLTYLTQHLPAGRYFSPVSGRDGIVAVGSEAELEALEAAIASGAAARTRAARRRLAFAALGGGNARLAADGLLELRGLEDLAPLAREEREVVGRVLRDARVPALTRIGLLELLGEREARDALPQVVAAAADTPAVLDAVLAARARLGAPADRDALGPYLAANDPAVRAAALRALALLDDPAALEEVGQRATTDPDSGVRVAAIEALGQSKRPGAVPVLSKTFGTSEREVKQASARAMMAIGGPAVENALVELALKGDTSETKTYAALILLLMHGRDHPAVHRLEASNPSPEVVELLEHGFEFRHSHVH